jgi:hypothetical protein
LISAGTFQPKIPDRNVTSVPSSATKLLNRKKRLGPNTGGPSYETKNESSDQFNNSFDYSDFNTFSPSKSFVVHDNTVIHEDDANTSSFKPNDYKALEAELQQIKTERDELLLEKKFWLTKFQEDNAKLLLLQNVCTSTI